MVEFAEVAEFMDDDVVGEVVREQGETIAEIEVACAGTTAPAGFLIADTDFVVCESVELIKILQPFMDQLPRCLFMLQIFFPVPLSPYDAPSAPNNPKSKEFHSSSRSAA